MADHRTFLGGDKTFFEGQREDVQCTKANKKVFDREKIVAFCEAKGIAIFDIRRLRIRNRTKKALIGMGEEPYRDVHDANEMRT